MRFFDRDHKWNFVDENNVVVGYDNRPDCCERFGFIFTPDWKAVDARIVTQREDEQILSNVPPEDELLKYRFDPEWFQELPNEAPAGKPAWHAPFEEGGAVAFRLIAEGERDLYLILYNSHNGYYSHGFTVEVGGQKTRKGSL